MYCTRQAACTCTKADSLNEPQGAMHEVGFRRFTVQKLEKLKRNNVNFVIERGQHGQFTQTWCEALFPGLELSCIKG